MGAPGWRLALSRLQSFAFHVEDVENYDGMEVDPLPLISTRKAVRFPDFAFPPAAPPYLRTLEAGDL